MPLQALISLPVSAYMLVAAPACAQHAPLVPAFTFTEKSAIIHHDKSTRELSSENIGSRFARAEFPITGGKTVGRVAANYEMSFRFQEISPGLSCFWTDAVSVKITYTPNVYIASDYVPGRCRYIDTVKHEMRHVQMDKDVLSEYLPVLKKIANNAANAFGTVGPLTKADIEKQRTIILASFKARLGKVLDQLNADRKIRQATIDTRAEYLRASHACAR